MKSVRTFTEDQCFCGIRYDKVKKNNLYLFDKNIKNDSGAVDTAKILNYMDQNISKFNAINLKSMDSSQNIRLNGMNSITFSKDAKKNNKISFTTTMGGSAKLSIDIVLLKNLSGKNQFNIFVKESNFDQNTSNRLALDLQRSFSHFDKNQLEVDVCRLMYVAFNQLSLRNFKNTIQNQIVKFVGRAGINQKATQCKKQVYFKTRYTNKYLTNIVTENFKRNNSAPKKIVHLTSKRRKYRKVIQMETAGKKKKIAPSQKIKKKEIDSFDDRSNTSTELSGSESNSANSNKDSSDSDSKTLNNSSVSSTQNEEMDKNKKMNIFQKDIEDFEIRIPQNNNRQKNKIELIKNFEKSERSDQSNNPLKPKSNRQKRNSVFEDISKHSEKYDNFSENSSSESMSESKKMDNPNYISLRNRNILKKFKSQESSEKSKDFRKMDDPNYINLRTRDVQKNLLSEKSLEYSSVTEIISSSHSELIENELDNSEKSFYRPSFKESKIIISNNIKSPSYLFNNFTDDEKSMNSEDLSQKQFGFLEKKVFKEDIKKKRKVIVIIETIECDKCLNDISVQSFLRLLNFQSRLI